MIKDYYKVEKKSKKLNKVVALMEEMG